MATPSTSLDLSPGGWSGLEQIVDAHDQARTAGEEGELCYPDVQTWVEQYLVVVFSRTIGGEHRWCRQWLAHPEAHTCLEALWRAWEHLRLDPRTGIAVWLRDHQLPHLMAPTGPFARYTVDRHEPDRPLPATLPPPAGRRPRADHSGGQAPIHHRHGLTGQRLWPPTGADRKEFDLMRIEQCVI